MTYSELKLLYKLCFKQIIQVLKLGVEEPVIQFIQICLQLVVLLYRYLYLHYLAITSVLKHALMDIVTVALNNVFVIPDTLVLIVL